MDDSPAKITIRAKNGEAVEIDAVSIKIEYEIDVASMKIEYWINCCSQIEDVDDDLGIRWLTKGDEDDG